MVERWLQHSFYVPLSMVPLDMRRAGLWLAALAAYGCDIFVIAANGTVPVWRMGSGVACPRVRPAGAAIERLACPAKGATADQAWQLGDRP